MSSATAPDEQQPENGDWSAWVAIGDSVCLRRTLAESDVYLFAGITGDMHPNHLDHQYMSRRRFGRRIVHGALLVGLMSGASTMYAMSRDGDMDSVSLGYDHVRFIAPAFIGDTLTVDYIIEAVDTEKDRATAAVAVANQDGQLIAVAKHITKYLR